MFHVRRWRGRDDGCTTGANNDRGCWFFLFLQVPSDAVATRLAAQQTQIGGLQSALAAAQQRLAASQSALLQRLAAQEKEVAAALAAKQKELQQVRLRAEQSTR